MASITSLGVGCTYEVETDDNINGSSIGKGEGDTDDYLNNSNIGEGKNDSCGQQKKINHAFYLTQNWILNSKTELNCNKHPENCYFHRGDPILVRFVNISNLLPAKTITEMQQLAVNTTAVLIDEGTFQPEDKSMVDKFVEILLGDKLDECLREQNTQTYYFPKYYKKSDRSKSRPFFGFTLTIGSQTFSFDELANSAGKNPTFSEEKSREVALDGEGVLWFTFNPSDFGLNEWPAGNCSVEAKYILKSKEGTCRGEKYSDCPIGPEHTISTHFTMGTTH